METNQDFSYNRTSTNSEVTWDQWRQIRNRNRDQGK